MVRKAVNFEPRDFVSEIINKERDIPKKSKIPTDIFAISWVFWLFYFLLEGFH